MNCVSCQASLAPRSPHCYFCGAAQPASLAGGGAYGRPGSAAQAQWMSMGSPTAEGWRLWVSFFLGGLYAPVASRYLLARERWNAGFQQGGAPPAPPSSRGLVVLGLFVGLPALFIAVLGFEMTAQDVRRSLYSASGWTSVRDAQVFGYLNLAVAGFYALSVAAARSVDRQFQLLIFELSGGDAQTLDVYRRGRLGLIVATVAALMPLALLAYIDIRMLALDPGWHSSLDKFAWLYMLAATAAAWGTSYLHLQPVRRFRRAMLARP